MLLKNISMENFFPNSGYRVCSRKTCLNNAANTISLMRKRIEGEEGVSEVEQFLNNRTKWRSKQ